MDMSLSTLGDGEGQGGLACCPRGAEKSRTRRSTTSVWARRLEEPLRAWGEADLQVHISQHEGSACQTHAGLWKLSGFPWARGHRQQACHSGTAPVFRQRCCASVSSMKVERLSLSGQQRPALWVRRVGGGCLPYGAGFKATFSSIISGSQNEKCLLF